MMVLAACSTAPTTPPTVTSLGYRQPTTAPTALPVSTITRGAAVDAVLAFFDALNHGLQTGDADPMRRMAAMSCGPCTEWVMRVQRQHDEGVRQQGGRIYVVGMVALGEDGVDFLFRASVLQESGTLTGPDGTPRPIAAGGKAELIDLRVGPDLSVRAAGPQWMVKTITLTDLAK